MKNAFDVIAETLSMSEELADLRTEMAAANARIAELEAQLARTWRPLEDGDVVGCTCGEETCEIVAYIEGGALTLSDDDWRHISILLGEEYALCKRVANAASDGEG